MDPAIARAAEILKSEAGARVRTDFPLAPLTTFRIGGPADIYFEPESQQDLIVAGRAVSETRIDFTLIGKGSNLLVSDRGFRGLVLRLGRGFRWASRDGNRLTAGGAMPLPALAGTALHHLLSGLEFAVAIPATLGGAVRMNAGAHTRSMADVLEKIDVFSLLEGSRRSVSVADAGFSYRRSSLGADAVVVGATVVLRQAPADQIREAMESAREWRRNTQPLAEPNCGSVFKNPADGHAAALVEKAGGKGMRVGGASVSTRHANFIVADPGTKAEDVLRLIRALQDLVVERSGVRLETEVHLLGGFDDGSR
jgi:UDP-N-acetylmuramate dehydrogenase